MPPIKKVLIANRGEIAARIIRAARDLDIATVAVFSPADATALFVGMADESVPLMDNAPAKSYLDADQLLAAATRTSADAIHPGYGFLSERSEFAQSCADVGITFIGPTPQTIAAMGSKVAAKEMMRRAGVPVLPGLTLESDAIDFGQIGEIGFPLLVKAAFGGGGRGMRIVREPGSLAEAIESAQREAESAFGNGLVFLEHFVENPRHIEVQIFGDSFGTVVHMHERECSIQRRYQKIIEEAPSAVVNSDLRERLGSAAVLAAQALSYVGAGTVEFVLDQAGSFYFLEVNTRLQVEHPVTEMVTGIDLVKLQFHVAEGYPLPPEATIPALRGHAIEVRLYAEDVSSGFMPTAGVIHRFDLPDEPGVRVDAGVEAGSEVSVHYDSMLAKIIVHAPDRLSACRQLGNVLQRSRIHGVTTNRALLIGILRHPDFRAGEFDTGFLERTDPALLSQRRFSGDELSLVLHPLAAALAGEHKRRSEASVLSSIGSGWRNAFNQPQESTFVVGDQRIVVRYAIRRASLKSPRRLYAEVDGYDCGEVTVRRISDGEVDLQVDGLRRHYDVNRVADVIYVDSAMGSTVLREEPRFASPEELQIAGSLLAPMPGTVVRTEVAVGESVDKGAVILVLEAMKMEHLVRTPSSGVVVELRVVGGQTVDQGAVLAVVEEASQAT
jgi:acetyl/propionyl-CoA carboxylase alpha subunit